MKQSPFLHRCGDHTRHQLTCPVLREAGLPTPLTAVTRRPGVAVLGQLPEPTLPLPHQEPAQCELGAALGIRTTAPGT